MTGMLVVNRIAVMYCRKTFKLRGSSSSSSSSSSGRRILVKYTYIRKYSAHEPHHALTPILINDSSSLLHTTEPYTIKRRTAYLRGRHEPKRGRETDGGLTGT